MYTTACTIIDVLLVEDNPADARMTLEAARDAELPLRLHVVSDGAEALDFLRRRGRHAQAPRPDLILLDLNLPGIDGREVLAEIMPSHWLRRIPVVVLTSSQAERDVLKTYSLHASTYVVKPMDFPRMVELMRAVYRFYQTATAARPGFKAI